jgi:hypothetical protein
VRPLVAVLVLLAASAAPAQEKGTRAEVYGHAMLDMGYGFKSSDPDWFDVVRPTKLPALDKEFGEDGRWFSGVRQSRLGVRTFTPTRLGELKTTFEFELFGVGVDAGQTTFRLRHAYGELGQFGAGQTWSPFMDIDVFPNSLEYWGPNGMVFFRNVQVRWMPIQGDTRLTVALERPGASGDLGDYSAEIEAEGVQPRFPAPDLSAEYRRAGKRGYIEVAGIVRYLEWDDQTPGGLDLNGDATGWGVNVSSNLKLPRLHANDVARLQVVYGEGIENYMNDAPVDVGVETAGSATTPFEGKALPVLGVVAFLDHYWNDHWSSSAGYSLVDIDNSNGQSAEAFHRGQYALVNLLHTPVPGVMMGAEFQWAHRENNSDGFTSDDYRIQFSAKYNFAIHVGGSR